MVDACSLALIVGAQYRLCWWYLMDGVQMACQLGNERVELCATPVLVDPFLTQYPFEPELCTLSKGLENGNVFRPFCLPHQKCAKRVNFLIALLHFSSKFTFEDPLLHFMQNV